MRLKRLVLRNFRNLWEVEITPHPGYNLLLGANGSGKTNLCEALYFAARGELLKGERQRELIAWGESQALIELELDRDSLKIVLDGAAQMKRVELNDKPAEPGRLDECLRVVAFTAADLQVVKGEPQLRRAFLDSAIAELDPEYKRYWRRYERVVSGKNYLLRQGQGQPDHELLTVYQGELAGLGARLLSRRLAYLQELNDELRCLQGRLGSSKSLELEYLPSLAGLPEEPEQFEPWLASGLEQMAAEEARRGFSLVGPHRDDLRFTSAGVDLKRFGSQGEQRLAILEVKLAQCELHRRRFGSYPILILDDLLSELDSRSGQLLLMAFPPGAQVFLTATELPAALEGFVGRTYLLEEGRVRERA
ncbi:MAG: DNA replication/repair protein RecF [Candidatus Bipolaricaulia bacterium]